MPAHSENGENVPVAKFELAFTRCRNNVRTMGNLMVKTRCKTSMLEKDIYSLIIDQSCSKSVEKCPVFIISNVQMVLFPECVGYIAAFKIDRFRNLPAKMCRFRVNGTSIRHIFHRFQNLLTS